MTAADAAFAPRVAELRRELEHHVKEEEETVLPRFAAAVDAAELSRLGERFEATKGRVPTRCACEPLLRGPRCRCWNGTCFHHTRPHLLFLLLHAR